MGKIPLSIDTGGGTYISEAVNTGGGDFISRDKIQNYYGSAYPRLNYRSDIAGILDFYTKTFIGREDAWRAIADFAGQQTPGYLLVEAGPGYGKSALLAHLVHRQETGQWDHPPALLYFFIRHEGGRNTPIAFLQALNSQLLNLLQGEGGVPADLIALRSQFSYLWSQVVATATVEQPLLLLIDGLDEMAGGETTIADELPALAAAQTFAHVVVSSRPNPKPLERVAIDHPFKRATVHRLQTFTVLEVQALLQENDLPLVQAAALAPRVHILTKGEPLFARFVSAEVATHGAAVLAQMEENPPPDVEAYFRQQFKQLDAQAEGELTWQILSLLSVTLGGITREEIAEVLKTGNRPVRKAIGLIERFLLGAQKVELMHLQLRKVVVEEVGDRERSLCRQQLIEWSQTYQQKGWLAATPDYILYYYAQHLANGEQWSALYKLIDRRWMKLKVERTFSHRAFAMDVTLAISAAEQSNNWVQLVRNCLISASLGEFATNVPPAVLGVLAQLGQVERALGYVALIQDRSQQSEAYCHIAEIVLGCGELMEAKTLLDQALIVARSITHERTKLSALSHIAQVLAQACEVDQAKIVANQVLDVVERITDERRKVLALDGIVHALAQTREVDRALTMAGHIADECRKTYALSRIAQALAQAGEVDQVRRVASQALATAEHITGEIDILDGIFQSMIQASEVDQALNVLKPITHESVKAYGINRIAKALAQVGELVQARVVANQVMDVAEHITDEWEKTLVFGDIVRTLTRVDEIDQALAVAEHIIEHIPKAEALCDIVQALAQAGDVEQARAIANKALTVVEQVIDEWEKAQTLSRIVQALTPINEVGHLLDVAERITDKPAKAYVLGSIAQALAQAGEVAQVRMVANHMLDVANHIIDDSVKGYVLDIIVQALAQVSEFDKALELARQITDQDTKVSAFNHIAQVLAQTGEVDKAIMIANHMLDVTERISESAKTYALNNIAQALTQAGQVGRARAVANQALAVADQIINEGEKVHALSHIVQTLAQAGEVELALTVANQITNEGEKVHALSHIVQTLAQAGKVEPALTVANQITDEWPKAHTLGNIVQALAESNEVEQALDVAGCITELRPKAYVLSRIAQVLVRTGKVDHTMIIANQTLAVAERIADELAKARILAKIVQVLIEAGKIDISLDIVECITDAWPKAHAFSHIAQALAQAGAIDQSRMIANQALDVAERITDEGNRAYAFRKITQVLVKVGEIDQALAVAERINEQSLRESIIGGIAQMLAQTGKIDQSLAIAVRISEQSLRESIIGGIAQMLAQAGKIDQALDLVKSIENNPRESAFSNIVQALARAGEVDQALAVAERIADEWTKADSLTNVAQALSGMGQDEEMRQRFRQRLLVAHLVGRQAVFSELNYGAWALVNLDQGETLWQVYKAIQEIDSWWGQ